MVLRQNKYKYEVFMLAQVTFQLGRHIRKYLLDTREENVHGLVQSQKDLIFQFCTILQ